MPKAIDLTGRVFGRLTALSLHSRGMRRGRKYLCQCQCGAEVVVGAQNLYQGKSTSCGCLQRERAARNLGEYVKHRPPEWMVGRRYHRWTVLRVAGYKMVKRGPGRGRGRLYMVLCRCDCGLEREVLAHTVAQGASHSCGCVLRRGKPHATRAQRSKLQMVRFSAPKPSSAKAAFRARWDRLFKMDEEAYSR